MDDQDVQQIVQENALAEAANAVDANQPVIKVKPPVSYEKRLRKMTNQELRRESSRLQKLGRHPRPVEQTGRGMNYGAATHTDLHTQATGIVLDAILDGLAENRSRYPGFRKR